MATFRFYPTSVISSLTLTVVLAGSASALQFAPYNPKRDYCGPKRYGSFVPDKVAFSYDFNRACYNHDRCYSECWVTNRTQESCDREFLSDMTSWCTGHYGSANPNRAGCLTVASGYYAAVRAGGSAVGSYVCRACTVRTLAKSLTVSPAGGTFDFSVVTNDDRCYWYTSTSDTWIKLPRNFDTRGTPQNRGSKELSFTVSAFAGSGKRSGTIVVSTDTPGARARYSSGPEYLAMRFPATEVVLNVVQEACSFSLSGTGQFGVAGGSGSIHVTASPAECAWTATTSADWITLSGAGRRVGSGTLDFSVPAYRQYASRTGTIVVAGQKFGVTQTGCTVTLSSGSATIAGSGGTGSVTVSVNSPSCAWSASTDAGWLTITSGQSGTGNGTVTYSAASNDVPQQRSAVITIAGAKHVVNQTIRQQFKQGKATIQ